MKPLSHKDVWQTPAKALRGPTSDFQWLWMFRGLYPSSKKEFLTPNSPRKKLSFVISYHGALLQTVSRHLCLLAQRLSELLWTYYQCWVGKQEKSVIRRTIWCIKYFIPQRYVIHWLIVFNNFQSVPLGCADHGTQAGKKGSATTVPFVAKYRITSVYRWNAHLWHWIPEVHQQNPQNLSWTPYCRRAER